MQVKEIIQGLEIISLQGALSTEIKHLTYDSRQVLPHSLFVAIRGFKHDGHQFIESAIGQGAVAIISEAPPPPDFKFIWIQVRDAREALAQCAANFYKHPSQHIKVIGITGTKGKTTVTYLLESILEASHLSPGVIGTVSYRGPGLSSPAARTTPESSDLQRYLKILVDHGATHCLMEVSSHALELKRAKGINFALTIFTNLSGEHLDYHQNMENYYQAKKKLFTFYKSKMAIINYDDPWGKRLIEEILTPTITYSLHSRGTIYPEKYSFSSSGIEATIKYPAGKCQISSPLLGRPNLYNILAATAASLTLGISPLFIKEGLRSLTTIPGRFEKIDNPWGIHIFVDYAHTDDALKNLLETAREITSGRVIVVFGAGGDRDKTKRPRMGEVAAKLADWSIITSDNPRSEDPLSIISEIEKGFKQLSQNNYEIEPDRRTAIRKALLMCKREDCLLVAGKGHEDYQIIGDKIISFHDPTVIQEIIKEMVEKRG